MLRTHREAAAVMTWERLPGTWKMNKYLWLGRRLSAHRAATVRSLTRDPSVIWNAACIPKKTSVIYFFESVFWEIFDVAGTPRANDGA